MKRLHIVGCPRSGTTLLLELLATCFHNDGHSAHEMSIFEPAVGNGDLFISKQPNDIRQLRHIFFRDEDLFVIYMGRDPRAVITSMHRDHPEQYFCNYRIWRACDSAASRYRGHPRFVELRYEDLATSPDEIQDQIVQRFNWLKTRYHFSDYHCHAQPSSQSQQAMSGLRPVDRGSLDKWRQHLPWLAGQCERHPELAQDLIRLGYEHDRQWLDLLQGVAARDFPCRYSEHAQYLREWEKMLRVYLKSRRYLKKLAH